MRPRLIAPLLAMPLVLAASAARADDVLRWSLQAGTGASYITDPRFDFVGASDAMPVGDLRLAYETGWLGNRIGFDLGYVGTALGGTTFQSYSTSLQVHSVQLGARIQQPVGRIIRVYGRVAGLLNFDGLTLTSQDQPMPLSQWSVTGGLLLGIGGEAMALTTPQVQVAFVAEFGYAFLFNQAEFNDVTAQTSGARPAPIPVAGVNLGALQTSGIQWRLGLAFHF